MKNKKFTDEERKYWADVLIATSQVTFGVAWASLFIPLDQYRVFVVLLNLLLSVSFWISGWLTIRRK